MGHQKLWDKDIPHARNGNTFLSMIGLTGHAITKKTGGMLLLFQVLIFSYINTL